MAGAAWLCVLATNLLDLHGRSFHVALLNANWQFSWSHDPDTVSLASGAVAAAHDAEGGRVQRRVWAATALILGLLLLDEVSPLHTTIGRLPFGKAVHSPILLGLVLCLWLVTNDSRERLLIGADLTAMCVSFAMRVVGLHLLLRLG